MVFMKIFPKNSTLIMDDFWPFEPCVHRQQQHSVNASHIGLPEIGLPIQPEMQQLRLISKRHQSSTVLTTHKIDICLMINENIFC